MSDDDHSLGSSILDSYEYGQISSCGSESSNNSIIYDSDKDPEYNINYENQCTIEYYVDDNFDVIVNHIVSLHILSVKC